MWELDTLQYDAITVCFPSGDNTSPNSLVPLKPNSIRHLIMLRKYIHHLVQDSHIDTIPTRNGRELGEIWVSKVGTNF